MPKKTAVAPRKTPAKGIAKKTAAPRPRKNAKTTAPARQTADAPTVSLAINVSVEVSTPEQIEAAVASFRQVQAVAQALGLSPTPILKFSGRVI
jgi:hypothetical protein